MEDNFIIILKLPLRRPKVTVSFWQVLAGEKLLPNVSTSKVKVELF